MADGSDFRMPEGVAVLLDANPIVGEARTGTRRFWTGREEKILRETYPTGGVPACLALLPGRTARSIYARAGAMGLHVASEPKHAEPWATNEHIDASIRRVYTRAPTRGDINKLAQAVMRPRWWVSKRARQLGLVVPRFKAPKWSPEELEIIAERATNAPVSISRYLKSRGYDRTETAVIVQLKRLHISRVEDNPDVYTGRTLAELMGVDDTTIGNWIAKGLLKAARNGEAKTYRIRRKDVRTFVIDNVSAVDIRKVDKWWFVELLAGLSA